MLLRVFKRMSGGLEQTDLHTNHSTTPIESYNRPSGRLHQLFHL